MSAKSGSDRMKWTASDVILKQLHANAILHSIQHCEPVSHMILLIRNLILSIQLYPQTSLQTTLHTLRIIQVNFYCINYNSMFLALISIFNYKNLTGANAPFAPIWTCPCHVCFTEHNPLTQHASTQLGKGTNLDMYEVHFYTQWLGWKDFTACIYIHIYIYINDMLYIYIYKTCFGKTYAIFSLQSDVCKALNRNYRMNKLTNYSDRCYLIRW